ncbi:MAG: hypothetical protein COV75_07725 [Candidatus Omnitrophica bacterium CG11_big_fil_rev_8_21_14_0_20_63_9]|nr:MAG: hypothetical protein COV75_07725 [Candidatus Omnitrophica bacterium CG11_big_fil_rev_8_21_14_0_20_63_9]
MVRAGWKIGLISLAAGLCSVWLAASPVQAKRGDGKDAGKHAAWLARKLKLSDEQRVQVEQIIQNHQTRVEPVMSQLKQLKQEKHDQIRAVLTPEQQGKFDRIHEKKMKHHH